jgi:hypothetical protein
LRGVAVEGVEGDLPALVQDANCDARFQNPCDELQRVAHLFASQPVHVLDEQEIAPHYFTVLDAREKATEGTLKPVPPLVAADAYVAGSR